jgi:hypothetical protein
MKKVFNLLIILFITIAVTGSAIGEEQKPAKKIKRRSVIGNVLAVNPVEKSITLKSKRKGKLTINLTDKTRIKAGKENKSLTDIKVDDRVRISYKNIEGVLKATSVRILPPKRERKSKIVKQEVPSAEKAPEKEK